MSSSIGSTSASRRTTSRRGSTSNRNTPYKATHSRSGSTSSRNTPYKVTHSRSGRMSIGLNGNTSTSNLKDRQLRMVLHAMLREMKMGSPPNGIGRANVLNRIKGMVGAGNVWGGTIKNNDAIWANSY